MTLAVGGPVLCVIGTRPEAVKMAPVILQLRNRAGVSTRVVMTGQHGALADTALAAFAIQPDTRFQLPTGLTLSGQTASILKQMESVISDVRPAWVVAQGDTTSVIAAALAAFQSGVKFAHVEAGLRTGDPRQPFPEEMNRRLADQLADRLFAPTESAAANLRREGHAESRIVLTGNTVVDALRLIADRAPPVPWGGPRRVVLVTAHRRESIGEPLRQIGRAVRQLAERFGPAGTDFVVPLHPNPAVRAGLSEPLAGVAHVYLIEPPNYPAFVALLRVAALVLTDSGGVQEEAPALGVPVLVLRDTTERPEGVAAGVARLVGTGAEMIVHEAAKLLADEAARFSMIRAVSLYGDGRAAERIVQSILEDCG